MISPKKMFVFPKAYLCRFLFHMIDNPGVDELFGRVQHRFGVELDTFVVGGEQQGILMLALFHLFHLKRYKNVGKHRF